MKLILMIVSLFCIAGPNTLFAEDKDKLKNLEISTPPTQDATSVAEEQAALSKMSAAELNKAIFAAVDSGSVEQLKPMLNALTYYRHNEAGETVLTQAILNEDLEMVRFLVEDAVINLKNKKGETPLTLALTGKNSAIIDLVIRRAKAALKNDAGVAPLMFALEIGDMFLVQRLVNKGADVNRKSNGITPIAKAVELKNPKMLAILIRNGADPSLANDDGDIPLYLAVKENQDVLAGILIHKSEQSEEDANWMNPIGETLINIAAANGSSTTVLSLLENGAAVNGVDMMENTPLHIAAEKGNNELVNLLLSRGADINAPNIMGTTPVMAAARNGHQQIAGMLAENGADTEVRDYSGIAAVDYGVFKSTLTIIDEEVDAVYKSEEELKDAEKTTSKDY